MMESQKKYENLFIYILAIGLFLNYSLYFWYGFWDGLYELSFSIADSYLNEYDAILTRPVILGTILMSIAFFIETFRVKRPIPIILSILSLFQVYFALVEFYIYNFPSYNPQIESFLLKLALDILELLMIVRYIRKSRGNHEIGIKLLKTGVILIVSLVFIAIIVGISTGLATMILIDFSFLIAIIFPVGILFCTNRSSKVEEVTTFEQKSKPTIKYCPECGEMNEDKANYCIECGFEIARN